MKKAGLTGLAVVFVAGLQVFAADQCSMEMDLVDGSRLWGTTPLKAIEMNVADQKMTLQIDKVLSVAVDANQERATVDLGEKGRIEGILQVKTVPLTTSFGAVSVEGGHIRNIRVYQSRDMCLAGLVLRYSFDTDNDDKVVDGSGRNNHGKNNDARWTGNGRIGGGMVFDGARSFLTTPTLDVTNDVTWAAWVCPEQLPVHHNTFGQIMGLRGHTWVWNSDNTSVSLVCFGSQPDPELFLSFIVQGQTRDIRHVFKERPQLNRWCHVAVTISGKGESLYLDGRKVAFSEDFLRFVSKAPMIIGANDNGPQRHFKGTIDEVMVFERALLDSEVRDLASGGRTGSAGAATEKRRRWAVAELTDGSRIKGEVTTASIGLRDTLVGDVSMPFGSVSSVQVVSNKMTVTSVSGDILKGKWGIPAVEITSLLGQLTFKADMIKSLVECESPNTGSGARQ